AVAWNARTGQPLAPAIGWQCRRTADACASLRAAGLEAEVIRRTGLVLDPYFSATKFAWLLGEVSAVAAAQAAGELRLGTVDSWLIWNLTGGRHVTDASNASRTLLCDIDQGAWSSALAGLFDVPLATLPSIVDSSGVAGLTRPADPFPGRVPIAGIAGDQQAALFGHTGTGPGTTKITYGTGCFLLRDGGTVRPPAVEGLLTTVAWRRAGALTYAHEGSVFTGGALIQWLRDELGVIATAAESEILARRVPDAAGAVIVPAFAGLGAPYWDPGARGAILGLTRGVGRAHICRAALEAIAHQVADVLELMPGVPPAVRVDGGAATNALLLEIQASVLGRPVVRPSQLETTALGAAYLAGLGVGFWSSVEQIAALRGPDTVFPPGRAERVTARDVWRRAVARAQDWAP
ncbi:MAG: glycerol kinase, partial [Actinobacteria bacterium]|nr:glycerol kinase [Actinomycetota bacterium]